MLPSFILVPNILDSTHSDLTLAFAASTLDNHHPLALVAGDEAVTYKLLDSRNNFRVGRSDRNLNQ